MRKSIPERRRKNANVGACWWASGSSLGQKGDAERKGKEAMRPDSEHKAALAGLECSSKDSQTKSQQKSQENNGRRLLLKTNKKNHASQRPIEHMELCSMSCGSLDGRGVCRRMDACVCVCCAPETIPKLLFNQLYSYTK